MRFEIMKNKKQIIEWLNNAMVMKRDRRLYNTGKNDDLEVYCCFGENIENNEEIKNYLFNAGFEIDDYHYKYLNNGFKAIKELLEYNDNIKESDTDVLLKELENIDLYEKIDSEVDIYTVKLSEWLASSINKFDYVNEVLEESFKVKSGEDLLMQAQYREIEKIFNMSLEIVKMEIQK
jgi:hypothetical protein